MSKPSSTMPASAAVGEKARVTESVWAWNQVVVAFLSGGLFQGLMVYCYSALMALIALDIDATQTELMYPKSAMMAVGAVLAPVIGILVDRHSIKGALALGTVVFATGLAVVNTGNTILQITLIFGLFFGPLQLLLGSMTTSALVSRWFTRRRGLAIGISNVGVSAGAFVMPFAIKYMSTDLAMGWREIFPVLSVGVLILILPIILLLTVNKPDDFEQTIGASAVGSQRLTTGMLFKDQGFWALGICIATMYGLLIGVLSNIVQISMENGLSLPDAMLSLSWLASGGVVGKLLVGYLSDRLNNCLLLVLVLLVFALSLLPPVLTDGAGAIYLFSFVMGFSAISALPLWHSLTASLFGVTNFSRVIGLTQPIVLFMTFACPLLTAKIYDLTGSFNYALVGYAAVLVATTLLVLGVRVKEKQILAAG